MPAPSNTTLTIALITREALRVLENSLTFTKQISTQFSDKFAVEGAKIGTVLNVRKPPRYVGSTGQALAVEAATETQVPVTLDTQFHVDISFSSQDLALSVDDFSERFLKPAVSCIANKIDADGLALYAQVANSVGAPGTTPSAWLTYLSAGVKLDNAACPQDGQRSVVMTPLMQATLVDALKGLFQSAQDIAAQYRKGKMGTSGGFDFYMDQNCATHTVGALGGTPLANAATAQTGSSIITDAWSNSITGVVKRGDVVQFAGVFEVNPQSRASVGVLKDFVVTSDVNSDGSGNATIPISPAIVSSGSSQNASAGVANNSAVTVFGSATAYASKVSPTGLAFHKDAFTLACADLPLPRGVDMAARVSDKQLGLSIRMVRAYDVNSDQFPCRMDILYGWAALRPDLACRIQG
jgi:hypothetical protein